MTIKTLLTNILNLKGNKMSKPTSNLRWLERVESEGGVFGKIIKRYPKVLQQKFISPAGEETWVDVETNTEVKVVRK